MDAFVRHTGLVGLLDRVNVDTDQIIPKQFLKRIERTGFGQFLFFDWRFRNDGTPNPTSSRTGLSTRGASVPVAGRNFGCGSSREHPLGAAGLRLPGHHRPLVRRHLLQQLLQERHAPVALPEATVTEILARAKERPGYRLTVDLQEQTVEDEEGVVVHFEVDLFAASAC